MLLSLSSACLYHVPLGATFRLAAEAGFDGIELVIGPMTWLCKPRVMLRYARMYGIEITSVHQALVRHIPFGQGLGRYVDAADLATELGAPRIVLHPPWAFTWDDPGAQAWLRTFDICRQRLEHSDTRLTIENPGFYSGRDSGHLFGDLQHLLDFARSHDVYITFDTCHAGTAGVDLVGAFRVVRERLINVHLSDLRPIKGHNQLVRAVAAYHQIPGEGDLPLRVFVSLLSAEGFEGPVCIEANPCALHAWSLRRARERLTRIVSYVRAAAR